jgi:hypothetical protein
MHRFVRAFVKGVFALCCLNGGKGLDPMKPGMSVNWKPARPFPNAPAPNSLDTESE